MAEKRTGRPPVTFSESQIHEVEALAGYLTHQQIADHFGISYNTFTAVMDRQPEVAIAYRRGSARLIEKASKTFVMQGLDGDSRALQFFLKAKAGWTDTINVNSEVNSNVSLNIGGVDIDPEKLGW
jgi:hypothetical protein